jgi:hypothetical protein
MKTADQVAKIIEEVKNGGIPLSQGAWEVAKACIGWAYVFAAKGEYCDPSNRRSRYRSDHPTIKTKCKNFNGSDSNPSGCVGCQWFMGSASSTGHEGRTRFFDCRGFTYWVLEQVYGWHLYGETTVTQWGHKQNWKAQGKVSEGVPKDTIVCLFQWDDVKGKMVHTGFGWNEETCECQVGVQYFPTRNKKWTHWAVPACVTDDVVTGEQTKPTLRRGDSGEYVNLLQTKLFQLGYDIGSSGVDGKFGKATESAVKRFQADRGLVSDGVVGKNTWNALEGTEPSKLYTATIPHLPAYKAEALIRQYGGGSYMTLEE